MALSHVEPGSLLLLVPVGDDVAQGLVVDIPGQVHGRQCEHLLHLGRRRESRGPLTLPRGCAVVLSLSRPKP